MQENFSMDIHKKTREYYLHYPKHSCQFLPKSIENICYYLNLIFFEIFLLIWSFCESPH